MNSNMPGSKLKFKRIKSIVFLTLFIYILNIFTPIYSVFGENANSFDINIYSKAAILVDLDTDDILYSKNGNSKVYPASTTKVLTAILALENLDLESTVIISENATRVPPGSSNAALRSGEVLTVKDLLYCLLLRSGNDSANVLAEAVSGSMPNFISLMNQKVKELGLTNTHFTNSHGYHDENHYTTPFEMITILKYAIKNDTFRSISSTKRYIVEPTNKTPEKRILQNTNRLILTKDDSYLSNYYEYCLGGKTGFTGEAGRTFLAFGKKDDRNVVLGNFNVMDVGSKDGRYVDAITLFEYGFNNFKNTLAIDKNDFKFDYIDKNSGYKYILGIKDNLYFSVKNSKEQNENASQLDSKFSTSITPNIEMSLLSDYDYNTTDTNDCQVVGSINVVFTNNSQTITKQVPLIVLESSKFGLLNSLKDYSLLSLKYIIFTLLFLMLLSFIFVLLLIIRANIKKKYKASRKIKKEYIKPTTCRGYMPSTLLSKELNKSKAIRRRKN